MAAWRGEAEEDIEQFQSPDYIPFMVLSLKVGGVGFEPDGSQSCGSL